MLTQRFRPTVADPKLQNFVSPLYKGVSNPNGIVGDGTAMSAANSEYNGGKLVGGRNHITSTSQYRNGLNSWLADNPNANARDRLLQGLQQVPSARRLLMKSGDMLVESLVEHFPQLQPTYVEHLRDNHQELLPHVIFWQFTQMTVNAYLGREPELDWAGLIELVGQKYNEGDDYLRGIVEVSFLENLPYPNEDGHGIVQALTDTLRNVFIRIRPTG